MLYVHVIARLKGDIKVLTSMLDDVSTMLEDGLDLNVQDWSTGDHAMFDMLQDVEDHLLDKRELKRSRISGYEAAAAPIRG
jgi:hypothetical protein